jgi:hypothetical protein
LPDITEKVTQGYFRLHGRKQAPGGFGEKHRFCDHERLLAMADGRTAIYNGKSAKYCGSDFLPGVTHKKSFTVIFGTKFAKRNAAEDERLLAGPVRPHDSLTKTLR